MRHWICMGVSLLFVAGAARAGADEIDHGDTRYVQRVAQAQAFEIQASELAARNAEQDEVKRYAREMVEEHGRLAAQLKALAADKGVDLPTALSSSQAGVLKALQGETGADFDRRYADDVAIAAHKEAMEFCVDAAEHARDPEVKAYAQQTLPILKKHLDAGMALRKSLAASGKASPRDAGANTGPAGTGPISPASPQAPPSLLPGDKGAPKP